MVQIRQVILRVWVLLLLSACVFSGSLQTQPAESLTATLPSDKEQIAATTTSTLVVRTPSTEYLHFRQELQNMNISELVQQITQADTFWKALAATEESLARAGITTTDLETTYVEGVEPLAVMVASPIETENLALEAWDKEHSATATLQELGDMLQALEFPFSPARLPDEHLIFFLNEWLIEAQRAEQSTENFPILFLAEMAKYQSPPVDLTSGEALASDIHLTLLELEILTAAFERSSPQESNRQRSWKPWASYFISPVVFASGPCTDFRKALGISEVVTQKTRPAVLSILEKGNVISKAEKSDMSRALKALGIAARIWKIIGTYRAGNLILTVEGENPTHKPVDTTKEVTFVARAGLSDKDLEEYENSFERDVFYSPIGILTRDCARTIGLPDFKSLKEIAEQAGNWKVEWRIIEGGTEHALASRRNEYTFAVGLTKRMQPSGKYSAESRFWVDLLPESRTTHEGSGKQKKTPVTVRAELNTSSALGLSTLSNAALGGKDPTNLAVALVDIAGGFIQDFFKPRSYATLQLEYHERGFRLEFDSVITENIQDEIHITTHIQSHVPLTCEDSQTERICRGEAPLEIIGFEAESTESGCTTEFSNPPQAKKDTFYVTLTLPLDRPKEGDPGIALVTVTNISIDAPASLSCSGPHGYGFVPFPFKIPIWYMSYRDGRRSDIPLPFAGGITSIVPYTGWKIVASPGHPIYAELIITRTGNSGIAFYDEKSIYKLVEEE